MTRPSDLSRLREAQKDALILALWEKVQEQELAIGERDAVLADLVKRVAHLEAELGRPPKGPGNSSVPPSQGQKANNSSGKAAHAKKRRRGHGRGGRRLHPDPDQRVVARVTACPRCQAAIAAADQKLHAVYDKIELPTVSPIVTQVSLYAAVCGYCGEPAVAPAPVGFESGSPFGPRVAALAVYLRYSHAIGYQRLAKLFDDLYGLRISEGALANLLRRVKPNFETQVAAILARLRQSRIVCSDETGARVKGQNAWEWVFQNDDLSVHVIRNSRAKAVAEAVMGGHQPAIWVSDLYGGQRGHGQAWQICLAHQLRDCQYAIEAGDEIFAPPMKKLLLRACALARRRHRLKYTTLKCYAADLERRLDKVMARQPTNKHGKRLRKRYGKDRDSLFTFMTEPGVPPTNNGSERDIRPSTIFRKVTNGFRSQWGADLYAAVRSILNTGRKQGLSAFQAIEATLNGEPLIRPG